MRTRDRVFAQLVIATVAAVIMVVSVMRTIAIVVVVVAHMALILWICMALGTQMLGVQPMHMAGLLGGAFGRSLTVTSIILVVHLALVTVVGSCTRLAVVIVVVVLVVPPAVARLIVHEMLQLVMGPRL